MLAGPRHAVQPATELLDVQAVPARPDSRLSDQLVPSAKLPGLSVLSLGDEVILGATLRANGDNLNEVLARVDVIVLDGVNIELPSTSLRLGQLAHEAVVVAYRNRSTHAGIERLARQLAQVSATVLGGILLTRRSGLRGHASRRRKRGQARTAAGRSRRQRRTTRHRPARRCPVRPSPARHPPSTPTSGYLAVQHGRAQFDQRLGQPAGRLSGDSAPGRSPGRSRSASARKN